MKAKLLSVAIASVIAGQASALNIQTTTPDLTLQISGATAADKQITNYVTAVMCQAGTIDRYNNPADSASAWFCNVPAANSGLSGDRKVLFRKESGGSSTGVEPVSQNNGLPPVLPQETVKALNFSTCTLTNPTLKEWTCSDTTVQQPAEVGISDVEPKLFEIAANGSKTVNMGALGDDIYPINAQTFGIVVTPALRNALQLAQGISPVGSDEVDKMPSLSSAVIANIFAGNVDSWDKLKNASGTGIATAAGAADEVNVCLRTPGSGTQAQFNAFYMRNACAYRGATGAFAGLVTTLDSDGIENNWTPPVDPDFGDPLPAPWIYKGTGSSDVGKCMTTLTNAGHWAMGVQSLEKVDEGRTNRNKFKYIAIDGVAPTLENVAAGLYHNWASASLQWRGDVVTGEKLTLAEKLKETAQNVTDVRNFNASLQDDDPTTSDDNRPVAGFRIPEILRGGVPANVGTLAFTTISSGGANPTYVPFNANHPVMSMNKGLTDPTSCAVAKMAGDIDVSQRH